MTSNIFWLCNYTITMSLARVDFYAFIEPALDISWFFVLRTSSIRSPSIDHRIIIQNEMILCNPQRNLINNNRKKGVLNVLFSSKSASACVRYSSTYMFRYYGLSFIHVSKCHRKSRFFFVFVRPCPAIAVSDN